MSTDFKNPKVVNELFDNGQIEYSVWVEDMDGLYWDVLISKNALVVVGADIISNHPWENVVNYGVYFGDDDEKYSENYGDCDYHWRYGIGEIMFFFSDCSGEKWFICMDKSRISEAKSFYHIFEQKNNRQGDAV